MESAVDGIPVKECVDKKREVEGKMNNPLAKWLQTESLGLSAHINNISVRCFLRSRNRRRHGSR